MRNLIKSILAILLVTGVSIFAQDEDYSKYPGYVDFGDLSVFENGEEVTEVLIDHNLLKMVAKFTKGRDEDSQELSNLLNGLQLIRVNTFEVSPSNKSELIAKVKKIEKDLKKQNWQRMVKAKSKDEITNIFLKTDENTDQIIGLAIMSIDSDGEASFVNIVGNIDMETIGKLSNKFDIPGLDTLNNKNKMPGSK